MNRNVIYFVDEDPAARRANVRELTMLLDNPEINVVGKEPFYSFADYDVLMANPETAAFVLDQRMKGSGHVSYNGTDLAKYLRGIDGKMPIYILTGHPNEIDDFLGFYHLVEYVIGKDEIEDVKSERAKIVKARILRHLGVFNDVRDAQEKRFHDLLVKSIKHPLTPEEQEEMDLIEGETTAPILAAERAEERNLAVQIEQLRSLLDKS